MLNASVGISSMWSMEVVAPTWSQTQLPGDGVPGVQHASVERWTKQPVNVATCCCFFELLMMTEASISTTKTGISRLGIRPDHGAKTSVAASPARQLIKHRAATLT